MDATSIQILYSIVLGVVVLLVHLGEFALLGRLRLDGAHVLRQLRLPLGGGAKVDSFVLGVFRVAVDCLIILVDSGKAPLLTVSWRKKRNTGLRTERALPWSCWFGGTLRSRGQRHWAKTLHPGGRGIHEGISSKESQMWHGWITREDSQ
jgi:hypothetical protein